MLRLRSAPFILFVALLLLPALVWAADRKVWKLGLRPPAKILRVDNIDARQAYARVAVTHLAKRLRAAGIKEFSLTVVDASTLHFETGVDRDEGWMAALLTAPGSLQLRPVRAGVPNWVELASSLPVGVEIRGEKEPWLWAPQRDLLEPWLARVSLAGVTIETMPDEGGVRTISLGETLGTERGVRDVRVDRSTTGAPYLEVTLDGATGARLAALAGSGVEQVAIVLDGEVIGVVRTSTLRADQRLRISVPDGATADTRTLRQAWVEQVAGRLAAPFPVPIAVLKE